VIFHLFHLFARTFTTGTNRRAGHDAIRPLKSTDIAFGIAHQGVVVGE
jgi:hypothetical protein